MRSIFAFLILISGVAIQGFAFHAALPQGGVPAGPSVNLSGRWRVKFALAGIGEKNLIFDAQAKGNGSFRLLDTGPDNKPVADSLPASWAKTTNERISISGEVELPFGTCCREIGTLIFKGRFISSNSISGKAIFIGSTEDEENFNRFRSTVGSFTATREPN